ncbi:MAG: recG, partial [Oscillospiraceae bacterium]|nr:recG [Oscillospiraceae bacterium]
MVTVMNDILKNNIQYLKGVGSKKAEAYQKLGLSTIQDLLRFYPRTYLDFSEPVSIFDAIVGDTVIIKATVFKKQPEQRIRKGMSIFKAFVTDHVQNMTITIFNSKYLYDSLEFGQTYYFYGKISGNSFRKEMQSPVFLPADTKEIVQPIYHQTEGLSSKLIRKNM